MEAPDVEVPTYYLVYKDRAGKTVKTSADKHKVRDLIRKGLLGTDVEGSKDPKGPFRPLMAFPEFGDLMKSRLLKEKGDQAAGGGMGDRFAEIDKQEARRRKMRKIRAMLARLFGWIAVLAVLGGGAWFAWTQYQKSQSQPKPATQPDSSAQPQTPSPTK